MQAHDNKLTQKIKSDIREIREVEEYQLSINVTNTYIADKNENGTMRLTTNLPVIRKSQTKGINMKTVEIEESKWKKIITRSLSSLFMLSLFFVIVYMGHVYICGLIFIIEVLLFRELVTVRYNTFFNIIEKTIPLFRTTQWMWFVTSIFYTYSDFGVEMIKSNTALHYLLSYAQLQAGFSFLLYSGTFVLTIATMQRDHIKFQLNQLCWTILVLCLTVGQLKYIMHNVYNGLIWFFLPVMLVIANDTCAWLTGVTLGRKFIEKSFFCLSPNKTWEGFIGGCIGTVVTGWLLSRFLAKFTWMICPTNRFAVMPQKLQCELDPIFYEATMIIPVQIVEIIPKVLVKMIPGMVNICSVDGDLDHLQVCLSEGERQQHHHFEFVIRNIYPVQIHALALSMFASFVAPFGGFLASAIKRAYQIKDFDSIIPGHGGIMDRMDCQFLMALCTWVHYNTFIKMATLSVPKMLYMYNLMKESEQQEFLGKVISMTK